MMQMRMELILGRMLFQLLMGMPLVKLLLGAPSTNYVNVGSTVDAGNKTGSNGDPGTEAGNNNTNIGSTVWTREKIEETPSASHKFDIEIRERKQELIKVVQ